jgi:hypothetical protein
VVTFTCSVRYKLTVAYSSPIYAESTEDIKISLPLLAYAVYALTHATRKWMPLQYEIFSDAFCTPRIIKANAAHLAKKLFESVA